ncbi:glycosyl transferase [Roseitranquillus sediminis]|uniref:glycosyl transferase n=1 Tax=Roseitranquillus sediminis TaxID=2809051 RepID=UPI001D0BF4F8|nr:glycosyl transferase [Roseitranquillus sediminis]MBM9594238.1 glycosyl transferase [Roseitranquillus sediminis]
MKQVISIKWGKRYGAEYPNRLFAAVSRHLSPPFRFICFTDDPTGLVEGIEAMPLPPLDCEMPVNTLGKWGKARLWSERLGGLTGTVLFIDLDVVILSSLDPLFEFGEANDVVLARNPNTPFERLGQTSIYRMPVGRLASLKADFEADPQGVADRFRFEQRFVTRRAPDGVRFWPRGWVAVYKWHCIPPFPLNYVRTPRPPRKAKVVIFPGPLNPPDAIEGRFRRHTPIRSPVEHLRATFDGARKVSVLAHLRHYVRPAPWVAEHWNDPSVR